MSNTKASQIPKQLRDAMNMDRQLRDTLSRFKNVNRYDFSKRSDVSAFERRVNNDFDIGNKRIKRMHNPQGGLKAIDRDGLSLKKRKQAVIHAAEYADRLFAERYPDLCIPDELLRLNCAPVGISLDYCDELEFTSVAAALWILDRLQEAGTMSKAFSFFPDRELAREKAVMPPMSDTCHSDDVILGVLYIIQHINVENDQTQMNPRKRFREIMKLIDLCAIKRAVKRFEDKQWENFDAVLRGINYHRQRLLKLVDEALPAIDSCVKIHEEMEAMCNERQVPTVPPVISSMTMPIGAITLGSPLSLRMAHQDRAQQLSDSEQFVTSTVNRKMDEIELEEKGMDLSCLLGTYMIADPDAFKKMPVPSDFGPAIRSLAVDDPYEICFAHLYMMEYNIGTVWLYHQSLAVLFAAGKQLPWNINWNARCQWISSSDELSKDIIMDGDDVFPLADGECEVAIDDIEQRKKLYQRNFTDKGLFVDPERISKGELSKVNLSQIVYAMTGAVIPRSTIGNLDIAERLRLCGMKKTQRHALEQYVLLANAQRMRTQLPLGAADTDTTECNDRELQDRLAKVRAENDRLNCLLKELHAERNAERKRADKVEESLELNRTELAELRSMVYDRSKLTEKGKETVVEFPYTVSCRITIFGGHEVWLNCMKPLLKGVRYVSATAKPNMSMLMNTDVIWLQTNVMGHSYYNKIVDTARRHDIPVKYFSFSSAEKCAEQLALDDMGSK